MDDLSFVDYLPCVTTRESLSPRELFGLERLLSALWLASCGRRAQVVS